MEKTREVLWAPVREAGLEHCRVVEDDTAITADGLVIGVSGDTAFRARYAISCDHSWRVRSVRVNVEDGRSLALDADGEGAWSSGGRAVPALADCIDVDLSVSPFTNALPVRRLALQPLESRELSVVYVEVPSLRVGVAKQRYTCLVRREDGTMHRYESGSFRSDVTFDADGLVIEYPRAFTRIWPR